MIFSLGDNPRRAEATTAGSLQNSPKEPAAVITQSANILPNQQNISQVRKTQDTANFTVLRPCLSLYLKLVYVNTDEPVSYKQFKRGWGHLMKSKYTPLSGKGVAEGAGRGGNESGVI